MPPGAAEQQPEIPISWRGADGWVRRDCKAGRVGGGQVERFLFNLKSKNELMVALERVWGK